MYRAIIVDPLNKEVAELNSWI